MSHKIYSMPFIKIYTALLAKVEKKGRTKDDLHQVIFWLTGYDDSTFATLLSKDTTLEVFFTNAPAFNPNAKLITGTICGCRVEEIEDELMWRIRCLDKLVDELAKGKAMEKILRM